MQMIYRMYKNCQKDFHLVGVVIHAQPTIIFYVTSHDIHAYIE